jgi:hypothetical protein
VTVAEMVRPRVMSVPEYSSTTGREAVELAAMAGLKLDPWQAMVLEHSLGERRDGSWAAFEVGVVVPRQNGKGAILEARELAGLFLLGERLVIHSAHQFDTSLEAFRRLLFLIEDSPDLDRRVMRVSRSHGEEGIELRGGQRIRFRTRTKGGGRGFSGDCLILDEAMILPEAAHGALLPTLSARPNPQVWYTGSAVDQYVHDHGVVLARVRDRGLRGDDPALAYFEWSAPLDETPDRATDAFAADAETWSAANPGLGIRISAEHIALELRSMDPRTFAVERLGVGDWPATDGTAAQVIRLEDWQALTDPASRTVGDVAFAFDVSPDMSSSSIAVAGHRSDGLAHVEVADYARGTRWVVDKLIGYAARNDPVAVLCDASGPAAALVHQLEARGVEVTTVNSSEYASACGLLLEDIAERGLRHLDPPELRSAIKGAARRTMGDAWKWSRRSSAFDISPLVACTLARWGVRDADTASVYETRDVVVL